MSITSTRTAKAFVLAGSMLLTLLIIGCSGNQNEQEFLNSAPPGKPSEFPNESVAQRKARTLSPSKGSKGAGANKPTSEKTR